MYTRNRPPGAYLRRRVRVHACKADKRKVSVLSDEVRPRPVRGVGMKSEFDNLGDVLADRHTVTRSTSASDDNLRGPHPRHGLDAVPIIRTPCEQFIRRSMHCSPHAPVNTYICTQSSCVMFLRVGFYTFQKIPAVRIRTPDRSNGFFFFRSCEEKLTNVSERI